MRLLVTLSAALILIGNLGWSQGLVWDENAVKGHCASEWQEDFSMQAYCIKTNKNGYSEFVGLENSVDIDRFGTPFQNCRSEWGVRWDMVAYCAKQQIEGYKSLDNIVQGISDDVSQSILRRCTDEWTNDYNMIGYCAKTQSNAWKALNN